LNRDYKPFIRVDHLKKYFPVAKNWRGKHSQYVKAVDDVSFSIDEGETLGLVGESGCGKSTTGRLLLHLLTPTSGSLFFDGQDLTQLSKQALWQKRREMQFIFQDPYAALNPRMTIQDSLHEPLKAYGEDKRTRSETIKTLIDAVGIPSQYLNRYPHEFSGGQLQRIGIARSLALKPKFVVADEPVAALDMSIQAQILNLMKELQHAFNYTYLFISHDLSVIDYMSDRIGVMYLGKMVELTDRDALYQEPLHPYTQALLSAIPIAEPQRSKNKIMLKGEIPSPVHPPSGCHFRTRCPFAKAICAEKEPEWVEMKKGHYVACHVVQEAHQ
jgi:oligopeptide transport system ATP-binding protein